MGRKGTQILIGILLLLSACVKDKPQPHTNTIPSDKHGVYVVCEGQFTSGNASLYLYKPYIDSVFGDLYAGANDNQPLGDVLQSMVRVRDYFLLVVNNANKVLVVGAAGIQLVHRTAIPYPRYILPVTVSTAYVSTMYSNKVYVMNTGTFAVIDSIILPGSNPEGMCVYDNSAYICTWDTATSAIEQIDVNTNKIVRSINVAGRAPHSVLVDKEQKLWVLSGNQSKGVPAVWTRIDPSTGDIIATYFFPATAEPIKPVLNPVGDSIYFIDANYYGGTANNGIYRMGIHQATLPTQAFIPALANQYFWALGVDPVTGDVYVGDPKGFSQKGSVSVYRTNGTKATSFNVGVGPGMFYFDN